MLRHLDDADLDRQGETATAEARRRGRQAGKTSGGRVHARPAPVTQGQEKPILAAFEAGLRPAAIAWEVRNWFARLRAVPVAADRSMPVLSVIMREAEAMGLRPEGSNPCRGIRRYRRKGRERFLPDEEIRRLSARLRAHENCWPQQVAIIRLLLLTGCRKGEILTLQWSDYREGRLFLRDSKTGPRTVWLSEPARTVLDGLERKGRHVFPAPDSGRPRGGSWLDHFWHRVRAGAELEDARLHDLRHTHASLALRQGETVLAIGRLLGHRRPETTLKYTHVADAMMQDAAETVGAVLEAG